MDSKETLANEKISPNISVRNAVGEVDDVSAGESFEKDLTSTNNAEERENNKEDASDGRRDWENEEQDDLFEDADGFFAKSFSSGGQDVNDFTAEFVGGLKALFETDEPTEDLSDDERMQRELDVERRESLDGGIAQNDADFLYEAGKKYDNPTGDGLNLSFPLDFEKNESSAPVRIDSVLEAMLFVGDRENRPLTLARACSLLRDVSELEALEVLADLNERYYQNGAPYKIVSSGDGYRLVLRPEYIEMTSKFGGKTREFKLSQTAIDVLALIAYRQPISLDEILDVRPNASSTLAQLIKRDLVARENKTVDNKKIAYYRTTERFLNVFNLDSLDDLPIVGDVDYR